MRGSWSKLRRAAGAGMLALALAYGGAAGLTGSLALDHWAAAQEEGRVPGKSLGNTSDSDFWRQARRGVQGSVSLPDKKYGVLVQSEGDNWRAFRNGPVSVYGGWALAAVIVVLAIFFVLRGRVRVEQGLSGKTIKRFNGVERFAHWLAATSFVVLALTGLLVLYGRYLFGAGPAGNVGDFTTMHKVFAAITYYGKLAHNFVAFGFMAGVVLILVLWLRDNIPDKYDLAWLSKGGGLLVKGVHPPAKKFNAGQKAIFWLVVLGGISLSSTGIALLFPYQFEFFSATFAFVNLFGFDLPTDLTVIAEMQLNQLWHTIVGLAMMVLMIAHIYIGTLGMEGSFWAMGNGQVDENWAREHHSVWAAEVTGQSAPEHGREEAGD